MEQGEICKPMHGKLCEGVVGAGFSPCSKAKFEGSSHVQAQLKESSLVELFVVKMALFVYGTQS